MVPRPRACPGRGLGRHLAGPSKLATAFAQRERSAPLRGTEGPKERKPDRSSLHVGLLLAKWAREELNLRPHAYQDSAARQPALTSANFGRRAPTSANQRRQPKLAPLWHHGLA